MTTIVIVFGIAIFGIISAIGLKDVLDDFLK